VVLTALPHPIFCSNNLSRPDDDHADTALHLVNDISSASLYVHGLGPAPSDGSSESRHGALSLPGLAPAHPVPHRPDFQWARKEILLPTHGLLAFFPRMLLFEYLEMAVVTFIKPIAVVILHVFGVLVFLLPASYALAFDKIKTIRD
jgi:hypothetical protein